MVVRMCVVLVGGGGANAVQKFVSLKIAAISVLAVTILPAGPSQIYTPAWPARLPRRFRNFLCFYAPAVRLSKYMLKNLVDLYLNASLLLVL